MGRLFAGTLLARREKRAALAEMWAKARAGGPALGLLAVGGCCGRFAAASGYRLSLRLLEKRLPPGEHGPARCASRAVTHALPAAMPAQAP